MVENIFKGSFSEFFKNKGKGTWCVSWDGKYEGYAGADTVFRLGKRAGIVGPLAAIVGRLVDYHICIEGMKYKVATRSVLEDSVESKSEEHTLRRDCYSEYPYKI